jgi:hypothetical protein
MISKISFIPKVPKNLIEDLSIIETRRNVHFANRPSEYASRKVDDKLQSWAQQFFNYPIITRWQVQKIDLSPHIDHGISGWKYVYYIALGGDNVRTIFWESIDINSKIICEQVAECYKWYKYKIDEPHGTLGLSQPPRISITIKKANQTI